MRREKEERQQKKLRKFIKAEEEIPTQQSNEPPVDICNERRGGFPAPRA